MALADGFLQDMARQLCEVSGVVGVVLGGSRARGVHTPESDYDIGIYYRRPLDISALGDVARTLAGPRADVTDIGVWGPWVDGGAWLTIADNAVDWLYRDLDRVQRIWTGVQEGAYGFPAQVGHPFGFADFAYVGELALSIVLDDPTGELTALRAAAQEYPTALSENLVRRLWESSFDVYIARKAVGRGDATFVAGCLFRAIEVCAHALHARAGRWLINEKGAVAAAGRLSIAPENFTYRAQSIIGTLGTTPAELVRALDAADELVRDTVLACDIRPSAVVVTEPAPAGPEPEAASRTTPAAPKMVLWEQHCCLPLQENADVTELARYPAGSFLSVNIGYSPQSKAQASALGHAFRRNALWDGRFRPVQVLDDLTAAAEDGMIALAFDLEDSGPLEGEVDNVRHFYDLGVRTMLPTYNYANAAGCGCLDSEDTGLSAYGRDLVREMNAVGMTVDGSHCSIRTGLELAEASERPMIYSHSNFASLWSHPRNITDDQARACAATGGVIGINGVGIFLGVNGPEQHRERVLAIADHIAYGVDLVGVAHIGVGSDYSFDSADFNLELATNPQAFSEAYTAWGPLQWVPPEDLLTVPAELRRRGFDDASIAAIFGGNFARVAAEVWS